MLLNASLGLFYFSLLGIAFLFFYRAGDLFIQGYRKKHPRIPIKNLASDAALGRLESGSAFESSNSVYDENSIELTSFSDSTSSEATDDISVKIVSFEESGSNNVSDSPDLEILQAQEKSEESLSKNDDELSPQKISPLLRRVEILIARKEFVEAKKILIRILSLQEDHPDASSHLAYIFLQTGELTKAENLFRKILESRPHDPSLLTNFALSILEQKNHSQINDAVEALKYAVHYDPKNAERYSNLGQALFLAGDPSGAVNAFENAIRYSPRNIEYLFFLADSYMAIGNYPFAKRIFSRILEISPLNTEAKRELEALQGVEG